MSASESGNYAPLDQLAEEFAARLRAGVALAAVCPARRIGGRRIVNGGRSVRATARRHAARQHRELLA